MPGFQELVVLFVIGLLILGPERLPRVAAQIGRWVGKARRTANQLRYQLEREIALADIEAKKKERQRKDGERPASAEPSAAGAASGPDQAGAAPAAVETSGPGEAGSPAAGGAAAPDGDDSG